MQQIIDATQKHVSLITNNNSNKSKIITTTENSQIATVVVRMEVGEIDRSSTICISKEDVTVDFDMMIKYYDNNGE